MVIIRRYLSLFIAVLMAFSFSGCGGSRTDRNEIVMWLVGSEAQAQTIMSLSGKFTEATGVKVLCEAIEWGNAHSKYLTSIAGDVTPDIGTMGLTWGMEFGELGAMVDLAGAYPQDMAELASKNFQGIVASTRLGDKVFGVPFDISEHIMYYRTDIVEKAPDTWEEMLVLLKKLKSEDRGMVMDWESLDWIGFAPFLWQAGGDFYNTDHTRVTLDTPEAARALDFFASLYREGVPKTKVPFEQGMRTGDYPIGISGTWKIISLTLGAPEIRGKWSIAMLPEGPSGKRTAFIGGRIMGVFAKSKMKDQAWEFIKFLSQPDIQVRLYEASLETEDSYLPPNMDTWKELVMDPEFKKVLENQARDAKGPPPVLSWDPSTIYLNEAIQMVVLKNADPVLELKKAALEMQKELDGSKK